jgi:predicted MFS family arabinose efflux permease
MPARRPWPGYNGAVPPRLSERTLLFLVGAVQFVNILDFMMVMPLGPDFAAALGIPASDLGLIGGAYTFSAAISGVAAAGFLDRFDRRRALAVAMLGLVVATAAGGLATGLGTMVAARVAAGAFGGPATSLSLSIVADLIPVERRGKALGAVMGAFSVASVLGVPAGLELAHQGGWRFPFFAVAALGLLVAGGSVFLMPPMAAHLARARASATGPAPALFSQPVAMLSLACSATSMMSGFAIIPNIAAHLQFDLGYPRQGLGGLYMAGGAVSFLVLRLAGRWVDQVGAPRVAAAGTAIFIAVLLVAFAYPPAGLPVVVAFVAFMIGNSLRNVSVNTLSSRVPGPAERARFMSAQSAVQHLASSVGAGLSTQLLTVGPDGRLGGIRTLAFFSGAVALLLPFLLSAVAAAIARREAAQRSAPPVAASLG